MPFSWRMICFSLRWDIRKMDFEIVGNRISHLRYLEFLDVSISETGKIWCMIAWCWDRWFWRDPIRSRLFYMVDRMEQIEQPWIKHKLDLTFICWHCSFKCTKIKFARLPIKESQRLSGKLKIYEIQRNQRNTI